jgi:hypothetical protein
MFRKSRYDILLGRPGTEIVEKPSILLDDDHLIIYGPRQSGRTQALIGDMVNYSRMGNNVCFFSISQDQGDNVRRRVPRCPNSLNRAIQSGYVFCTYNDLRPVRGGLDPDGLYLDDFIRRPEDFPQRLEFFNAIMPLFCHSIRIVIASLTKEMPFDTTGWTFRELAPSIAPPLRGHNRGYIPAEL